MDAAQTTHPHRTFARANGLGGAAIPHLVAAEERHRKNLQHIQQLKVALCSTVSSAAPRQPTTPTSCGESLPCSSSPSQPSRARPAWGVPLDHSTGIAAFPTTSAMPARSASKEIPISAAVLQSSQQEVEQLIREKHQLQRQCIELTNLLANTPPGNMSSALTVTTPAAAHDPPAWSPVHDAALAVVEQVARCYPSVVQDWAISKSTNDAVRASRKSSNGPHDCGTSSPTASPRSPRTNARYESSMFADTASITADGLVDSLHRLAAFLPQLASIAAVSELIADAGPDMLDNIHILEEEKRNDCLAVLSITDHLTKVSAQMRHEAAKKDAALAAMQQTIEELMEEKQDWSRRARASEAALAERYAQYRQHEKAWEMEVAELLQSRNAVASAAAAPAVEASPVVAAEVEPKVEDTTAAERAAAEARKWRNQLACLQEELDAKSAALERIQQERDDLQSAHATLQASSQETAAAHQARIATLERQLQPLESELQTQAETIRAALQMVDELRAAHRTEVAALNKSHTAIIHEKETALGKLEAARTRIQTELTDVTALMEQRTAELQAVTAARDAAQAALAERDQASVADCSSVMVAVSTPLRLPPPDVSGGKAGGSQDGTGPDEETVDSPSKSGEGDNDDSTDFVSRCTNVRKLQQSLKRMSRERNALVRKLEHRGTALVEMETELEAAQRLVAQYEAHIQVLRADVERADASAARDNTVTPKATNAAVGITPINWIAFSEVEQHEEVEGTLYPTPVDLMGWLLEHREPLRFEDYVARHLSQRDQFLIGAVGPLYHVGFSLLKAKGLLGHKFYFPVVWRRFLLQLQQTLDVQLEGLPLSPADSARRFYQLASTAGLFKGQKSAPDPLKAYTLILAALCVCLRPREGDEAAATAPGAPATKAQQAEGLLASHTEKTSERCFYTAKWRCCQAILRHVCDQGDGEDEKSRQLHFVATEGAATPFALFMKLALQDAAAVLSSTGDSDMSVLQREMHRDSRSDEAMAPSAYNLASLLSHGLLSDVLPLSRFSLLASVLQQAVRPKADVGEGRYSVSLASEHRLSSLTTVAPRLTQSQHLAFVSLLLYIARYEYLLCGWHSVMTAPTRAEGTVPPLPSLEALGVRSEVSFSDAKGALYARTGAEDTVEALVALDAGLLPAITMCICTCRPIEHEPWLLTSYFETRRALVDLHQVALSSDGSKLAPSSTELCPGVPLLTDTQLRDCIQQVLLPLKQAPPVSNRVVQVPTAEYERLHRELLSLYQTNEANDAYIQELLGAVEAM
ncbi:hypothetical protein ABL78_0536 [Leptomonas seymouri]|uniref:Uncharacterized protein n=1 Tax=Leptomonas seymouri TaxID=5684 RepID=A0A0N0P8T3_LEPSE|nr:hypothetical protein ABL78_0536 [Leptomonas seymouri]|eukprot:KPI90309.1 hypothetical protein ABL78_0536 [Leptomonas seymouri]